MIAYDGISREGHQQTERRVGKSKIDAIGLLHRSAIDPDALSIDIWKVDGIWIVRALGTITPTMEQRLATLLLKNPDINEWLVIGADHPNSDAKEDGQHGDKTRDAGDPPGKQRHKCARAHDQDENLKPRGAHGRVDRVDFLLN